MVIVATSFGAWTVAGDVCTAAVGAPGCAPAGFATSLVRGEVVAAGFAVAELVEPRTPDRGVEAIDGGGRVGAAVDGIGFGGVEIGDGAAGDDATRCGPTEGVVLAGAGTGRWAGGVRGRLAVVCRGPNARDNGPIGTKRLYAATCHTKAAITVTSSTPVAMRSAGGRPVDSRAWAG